MTAHERAVKSALSTGDDIDRLINSLGSSSNPKGRVLVAYRNGGRALRDALGESGRMRTVAANEAIGELRRSVTTACRETLTEAVQAGQAQAQRQLEAYGLAVPFGIAAVDIAAMLAAWLARFEAQAAAAQGLVATGADPEEIIGDGERAGVLRPAPVIAEGSRWVANAVVGALILWLEQATQGKQTPTPPGRKQPESEWYHQAVAAIDERTTECCLMVHGQTQPLDQPFKLDGEPRYADELDHPPFHWYCRTAEALVHRADLGDKLTGEMQDAAADELAARAATGKRVEIHPAHARSHR